MPATTEQQRIATWDDLRVGTQIYSRGHGRVAGQVLAKAADWVSVAFIWRAEQRPFLRSEVDNWEWCINPAPADNPPPKRESTVEHFVDGQGGYITVKHDLHTGEISISIDDPCDQQAGIWLTPKQRDQLIAALASPWPA